MAEAYIIDACRTPRGVGKVGKGALAHLVRDVLHEAEAPAQRAHLRYEVGSLGRGSRVFCGDE